MKTSGPIRIEESQGDFGDDERWRYNGELFTGVVYQEHPVAGPCEEQIRDGVAHGYSRQWFPDGTPKEESWYVDGRQEGVARTFDASGSLVGLQIYEQAQLISNWERQGSELKKTYDASDDESGSVIMSQRRSSGYVRDIFHPCWCPFLEYGTLLDILK